MSLYYCSINSGSNGNCYYVGSEHEAILIDVGISCRELEKRMANLKLEVSKIKAIFISHEHTDHIKGLSVFAKKHQIAVYINPETLIKSNLALSENLVFNFCTTDCTVIGDLSVYPFPKSHDAINPYSFTVGYKSFKIGIFTDIGSVCSNLTRQFSACDVAFLEANYDTEMLENGLYPYYLKKRISGDYGHLSNQQALDLFLNHKSDHLKHILLCHLSKDNNCPDLVERLFTEFAGNITVSVASRLQESKLYSIYAFCNNKIPDEYGEKQLDIALSVNGI